MAESELNVDSIISRLLEGTYAILYSSYHCVMGTLVISILFYCY